MGRRESSARMLSEEQQILTLMAQVQAALRSHAPPPSNPPLSNSGDADNVQPLAGSTSEPIAPPITPIVLGPMEEELEAMEGNSSPSMSDPF